MIPGVKTSKTVLAISSILDILFLKQVSVRRVIDIGFCYNQSIVPRRVPAWQTKLDGRTFGGR